MDKKKVRHLKNSVEAQVMAMFLANERNRHIKDIQQIERDLEKLRKKWGVEIPWDYMEWVEV